MAGDGTIFPKVPLSDWIEDASSFLDRNLDVVFGSISDFLKVINDGIIDVLQIYNVGPALLAPLVLIVVLAALAWWLASWESGLFTLIGLGFINNLGYWDKFLDTFTLIIMAVVISMVIAIPIGVWMSQKSAPQTIITPILDFMQTMPAFVYLIPAVLFFGLGTSPGLIATVIFAMPPTVRMTNLGIRQVSPEVVEAASAFGSTTRQRLIKVQMPLSMPTLMAGVNQTIMLSLSMVVIASLVGAPGLGEVVYQAVSRVEIGSGFEGGLGLVIMAIVLDRITQGVRKKLVVG